MTAENINAVKEQMQKILSGFVPVLNSWMSGGERMIDPFETEYSENYAPANAAVIYASVYRTEQDPEVLLQLRKTFQRSVNLLEDREGVAPFCRVFLFHYSLMALLVLPEADRQTILNERKSFYAEYRDDCVQQNTNCAALQLGIELYLEALGCRPASIDYLNQLLQFIEDAQNTKGFINDEVDHQRIKHDGMPIAYHAFTLFILTSTLAIIDNWNPALEYLQKRAETIIEKGIDWLKHAVSLDGTFAMIERSSYQTFTWGAFVVLTCYSGLKAEEDEGFLEKAFVNWLSYQHDDGTFSCTPNLLPHQLRTGYESYTHVNMYNNLGLTGIAVAERILQKRLKPVSKMDSVILQNSSQLLDLESGYAFVRRGMNFFGCTLRIHNRRYAPAMQAFHLRLGNVKLPLPEPRFDGYEQPDQRFLTNGIWEGYLLEDASGRLYYPDNPENAEVTFIENGLKMQQKHEGFWIQKSIRLLQNGFQWDYELFLKQDFSSCQQVVPLLLFDGEKGTRVIEKSPKRMDIVYAGHRFELTCSDSFKIGTSLQRSLLSSSGVATKTHIHIDSPCRANTTIRWSTLFVLKRDGADFI